jgi:hypothetical protein
MPSSNRVSWQLFLVFTIWICAVLVRPFAGDNNVLLFTTRLSGSIDGSRASNSNLRPGIPPGKLVDCCRLPRVTQIDYLLTRSYFFCVIQPRHLEASQVTRVAKKCQMASPVLTARISVASFCPPRSFTHLLASTASGPRTFSRDYLQR